MNIHGNEPVVLVLKDGQHHNVMKQEKIKERKDRVSPQKQGIFPPRTA